MLKALKKYLTDDGNRDREAPVSTPCPDLEISGESQDVPPVIWRGTVGEYRSLLVLREAELVAARAQLTGNDRADWYARNRIGALEKIVADLRTWLAETKKRDEQ